MRRRTFAEADSNRRDFLKAAATITALPMLGSRVQGVVRRRVAFADDPFSLGVTSGDPTPDGFVIQARLAPRPPEGGGVPAGSVGVLLRLTTADRICMCVLPCHGTCPVSSSSATQPNDQTSIFSVRAPSATSSCSGGE